MVIKTNVGQVGITNRSAFVPTFLSEYFYRALIISNLIVEPQFLETNP